MRQIGILAVVLFAMLSGAAGLAKADVGRVNLIVNPNFERVYAAQRDSATDPALERTDHKMLPKYEDRPALPYGWNLSLSKDEAATLSWVDEAGLKALRVQVPKGESARLVQCYVEVVPGGAYDFGLGVKGSGRVNLFAMAGEPAPDEWLTSTGLDAGAEWKQIHAQKKIDPHRHLAKFCIDIPGPADVTIRGAEFSVPTASAAPADPLTVKPVKDADTIFFEDFDGPTQAVKLNSGARLTDKDGGRFGRGLITSDKDGGAITHLSLGELPVKGTIEFWFKPSSLPGPSGCGVPLAITTLTPGMSQTQMEFRSNIFYGVGKMGFGFRQGYNYERATAESAGWWRPGTWHHIAGSWDGDVMRLYADGVMEAACYGKDKMFPHGIAADLILPLNGVIDEIRISKSLRYGPVVPEGVKTVLYSLATTSAPPPAPMAAKDVKEEDLDKERAKLISPVPPSTADYTFGIDQVRPAWEGMTGMKVQKDYFGKGVDGMEAQFVQEPGRAMYWRVEKVQAGDYYVGLWVESSNPQWRTEYAVEKMLASAYLNGWPVRFSTSSDPVQVRPGVWLAELQAASPVKLKEGDEIAVWPTQYTEKQCFLRLALYRKEPARGHGLTGQTFGVDCGNPQRLRLVLSPEIKGEGQDGQQHEARIEVANPLPYAVEAQVTWKLADYYGAPLVDKTEPVILDPHKTKVISHSFTASGDARAYQLDVKTRPAPGFKFPVPRPVEMLDLSNYSRWEFHPDQPDPLTVWSHTRKDLADNRTGDRKVLCLDGTDWEWAYLDGRRVPAAMPAGLVYNHGIVPYMDTWIKQPVGRFGKWFRKSLVVPAWMKGQRYLLEISLVQSEATIYVNGQQVGYGVGALPVTADITKALKPGVANELVICVRGGVSATRPEYVDQYDPENYRAVRENEDVYNDNYGQPCIGSVYLRAVPEVRVKQSLVVSDADRGKLRVMTRLENSGDQPRQVTLRFAVFQNGKPVAVPIPEKSVTVTNGTVAEVAVDAPAGDLATWTPRNPVLAKMVTTVLENGKVLDTFDRRFGYRDMKIKGTGFVLNGKPIRFIGVCCGGSPQDFYEGDLGVNFMRGTSAFPELADEIGVPHLWTVYQCGDNTWPKLNNKKYWDSWRHYVVETVWNEGSRAGIMGWQLSCEVFYTLYTAGKEGQEKEFELTYSAAQEIRKIWPNYFCIGDGDGTLGGRLDFASYHYWNQYSGTMKPQEGGFTYESDGVWSYPPEGFFMNGASRVPRKGTLLHMSPDWVYGSTACGSTEDYEYFGTQNGVANSRYIGDRAAISGACTANDPRGMAWTKMSLEGDRDMDQAMAGCVYANSFYGAANPFVSFCMPEREIRYYSGAKLDRRLDLFDDEQLPGKLEFRWTLLDPSGKTVSHGEIQAQSDTAFLKRDRVAFDIPQVSERTRFILNMELWKDGAKRAREEQVVDVWPALQSAPKPAMKEPVRVFDPGKTLLPCLEKIGCQVQVIDSLDAAALAGAKCLIIGPGCVTKAMADKRDLVRDFVRDGGRVLVLPQEDPSLLPLDVTYEKRAWRSIGFVRAQTHPVMRGLQDADFQMWNRGHVIAKGALRNPDKGAFLTLVDSGHDDMAVWAEMMEFYIGQGSMVATQLVLTDDFDTEPMAAEMLKRVIAYLGQPVFRAEGVHLAGSRLAVLNGASETVLKRLGEVRTDYVTVAGATADQPVTLIDLSTGIVPNDAAAWQAYVQQGGTLLVHRATPKHQAWLESLTAKKVSVEVQPYQSWVDRQMLERRDGLVTGLSNLDLYWRSQAGGEGKQEYWQVSCGVETGRERGQVQYVVRVDGARDYLFPGGLVEVPVGKGRVVIDQIKWEASDKEMISGSPARCISVLLTNLGVDRKLPVAKPALPKGVTYEPIDVSAVANRGFKDDKAGDGIGWLDWGADADMSSFPTGKIDLGGVPYLVPAGDKNAIVLRMDPDVVKALAAYPDTVNIPVGKRRVAGLLFLHTGGWAWGVSSYGERRIEYDDGTKEIIRLNGTNMADWNPGFDLFPDEEGTTTTVAWKGANTRYPVIRVYQTLWVNPHPEKTIKQVVISNAGLEQKQWRFVAHFGLTAAILPAESATPVAAKDPQKSQTLFHEASTLMEKKQTKEAAAKLQSALDADDQNTAAWTALTGLRAETDSVEAFTALGGRWAQAMPKSYQPHNVLGKFLETKGKFPEALAEYKKSIEIEANQPPIREDIERLDKKLKEGSSAK
jgi:hypothetical protein